MRKRILLFVLVTMLSFLGGSSSLQLELDQLKQHGCTYRFLGNDQIEIRQDWSGFKRVKTLKEPSEASIRAWAAARNVPILEIDPSTLDTSRWSGWFKYWATIPLSNGFGMPLIVGDIDNNGKPEVYGIYKDYRSDFETHVYEIDSLGGYTLLYNYVPRRGGSRQFADVDHNRLREIVFSFGDSEYDYEQSTTNTIPMTFKLRMQRDSLSGSIFTGIYLGDLDGNGLTDFVYTYTAPDTIPGQYVRGVRVDEYNPTLGRFMHIWSTRFNENIFDNYGGFTAGDFDGDGRQEFECCQELQGKVYVVKSTGIHSYKIAWSDSTPFVNLFYQTSGDIDGDGRPEIYVGATMSNGNWTTMYEADSVDHYSPHFIFHLLSGGTGDEPVYLVKDIDHDGKLELIILSGADLYVFKSIAHDSYYLWYYHRFDADEGIQFYDFNKDGKDDFILSRTHVASGNLAHFADIYLAQRFTSVTSNGVVSPTRLSLAQNYPNPFNPVTVIKYTIGEVRGRGSEVRPVVLKVFDVLGREVATLVNEPKSPGEYSVRFDASGLASGVYLYRIVAGGYVATRKMIAVR